MTTNRSSAVLPADLMTTAPTVQDVLRGALDLLARDGWSQHLWRDGDRRCLLAAVHDAATGDPAEMPPVGLTAIEFLRDEQPDLVAYNDDPTTTVDGIVFLLERTLSQVDKIADLMRQGGADRQEARSAQDAVIARAIDLLESDGWCQGRNTDGIKRCLQLALAHAAQQIGQYSLGYQQAFAAVERLIGGIPSQPPGNKLSAYNDLPTTSYEDVILLLKEVMAKRVLPRQPAMATTPVR